MADETKKPTFLETLTGSDSIPFTVDVSWSTIMYLLVGAVIVGFILQVTGKYLIK